MAIATKCTCGYSITGVCTSSVKECRQLISMEENTQLPVEVVEQIKQEGQNMLAFATDNKWSYIQGATAYATKLHLAQQENAELRRQNDKMKQQAEGWRPLLEKVLREDAVRGTISTPTIEKITKFLYGE